MKTLDEEFLAGKVYEASLERRRAGGNFYTSAEDARWIAAQAFELARVERPSVCDPACGCGAFLIAAKERGAGRLVGADVDAGALQVARNAVPGATLIEGESLLGIDWSQHGTFDVVLVNPPYQNMVAMDASQPGHRRAVREQYATATGGFDLYVPFLELALRLVRPGGVLAALTPNKLLSSDYAEALRNHLAESAELLAIRDLRNSFDAAVYPCVTFFRKGKGIEGVVRVHGEAERTIDFGLRHSFGGRWSFLLHEDAEELAELASVTGRLTDVAEISGAATVSEAYEWEAALVDSWERPSPDHVPFLTSGTIRAGENLWGREPVRYLKKKYARPWLDQRMVSSRRQEQIIAPKVIVSGMAKRPTAVWMPEPCAAAKSTVIVLPKPGVSGTELAERINSDEFARLYSVFYESLALAGGYMRFGPRQLREIPVRW